MSTPMEGVTFDEFVGFINTAAKVKDIPSVISGLKEKGAEYSLVEDDQLDSLDAVEMIIDLEESLQKAGHQIEIPEELTDKAKDVGDIYRLLCEKYEVEPVMPA